VRHRVTHSTTYAYAQQVALCHNEIRLTPRATPAQAPRRTQLLVEPVPSSLTTSVDYFGNTVTFMTVQEPHEQLTITAMSDVDVTRAPAVHPADTLPWETVRDHVWSQRGVGSYEAFEYLLESPHVRVDDEVAAYAAPSFAPGRPVLAAALELSGRIHADFAYVPRATTIATPVSEVLAGRRGVCQDFAHLALACLRAQGVPARYVSGYLETEPAPGRPRVVGADASHAWVAVFCGPAGWVDLDPTNAPATSAAYVTLAWGRDYADVAPVKGVILGGGEHTVRVAVDVQS
jgi:transglutaminase-like putative cysteine protease